jgi:N-acetylglutamate synthase-like GNAT family acetyltransferase
MNSTSIRKATESDLPAIQRLLVDLIDALEDSEGIDIEAAVQNCQRLVRDAASYFLVADMNGTPVGLINFTIRQTVLHRSPSGLIDELVVASDYRGEGVGGRLVLAAIEKCRALGCREVEVSTEMTNLNARKFYEKCGFEERGMLLEADL